MDKDTLVIGLTGSFGSGCTEAADYLTTKGFLKLSLSGIIRDEAKKRKLQSPDRTKMQNIGDELRKARGSGYLMKETLDKIGRTQKLVVVECVRNRAEVYEMRQRCSNSYLINVDTEKDIRYKRKESKYSSKEAFDDDDERDSGEDQPDYGQQVKECVDNADIIINNNKSIPHFYNKLEKYLGLIAKPQECPPPLEGHDFGMACAFRESRKSLCRKRKVGAAIMKNIRGKKEIVAVGYNDVPDGVVPCSDMGRCVRDDYRDFICFDCKNPILPLFKKCNVCQAPIPKDWRKEMRKHIDLCRALHAEERAILDSGKEGKPLRGAILYTTTYPCLLCVKKIIHVGIKEVVYLDPYPYKEATDMLTHANVSTFKFEGVMERAFDRLYRKERI